MKSNTSNLTESMAAMVQMAADKKAKADVQVTTKEEVVEGASEEAAAENPTFFDYSSGDKEEENADS